MTDFAWAAINALCRAFNNINVKKYIDICFDILVEGDTEKIQSLTVLRLCSSHNSKNMKVDISRSFKKEQFLYIAAVIGGILDLTCFKDAECYLKYFLVILMSKYQSSDTIEAHQKFQKFAESEKWSEESKGDEKDDDEEKQSNFEEFETIYRNSKFFQMFDKFVRDFKAKKGTKINPYFNPNFAATFIKKYVAFLPLWSGLLTCIRYDHMKNANNGLIEGKLIFNIRLRCIKINKSSQQVTTVI